MIYMVKLAIHDYPKRCDMMRTQLMVEGVDPTDAMSTAIELAKEKYPGGKAKAFDAVIVPRETQPPPKRKILTTGVKRSATA